MTKIAIIGSGIGGLSAGLYLKKQGIEVHIFEKNNWVGGKLREFEDKGFRFDKGPSLFTAPEWVDEVFELYGKDPRAYYEYHQSDEACRYFDADGKSLIAYADPKKLTSELTQQFGEKIALRALDYIKLSKLNYALSLPLFIRKKQGIISKDGIKMMLKAKRMGIFKKFNRFNEQRLKHPFLVKIFNRFATYNGSNPYECPAVLNCIPALEHGQGTFFPKKGMYQIVKALHRLALENNVLFNLNYTVTSLKPQGKKWLINDEALFDAVVINGDYFSTQQLLPKKYQIALPDKTALSTSGLVFYWGMNKKFPQLGLHNIFFAHDYKREFEFLRNLKINEDLTVYVHISSKLCPDDAPEGGESWFVMINVPPQALNHQEIEKLRLLILQKLGQTLGIDLRNHIVSNSHFQPLNIQEDTSGYSGALYGYHSNSLKMMMSRPDNTSKAPGIFYAGGTVFPGGGIPLCMSSGKIAAQKVIKYLK